MELTLLLADAAQADQHGKVHALGLAWTNVPTPTPPMAVIVLIDFEADEVPASVSLRIELQTEAGEVVVLAGGEPVRINAAATAHALDEEKAGEQIRVPFSIQIGPGLPLPVGLYQFEATAVRDDDDNARAAAFQKVRVSEE
ncbi:hypothetical protein [Williamsia sp. DF01-3]|uniref:DUF6941 family protein n=1 Tax=Williamsia sp. DF01-3 TaxID=2934157 RepID=UPI001FF4FADC|nr:hypothetical protein [Williamsia sp. DF01-3]MCK0516984.1 hypothetical protein [Williamsia sp. DF01-3]